MSNELSTKPIVRLPKNGREEIWLALDKWTDPTGESHDLCNMRIFANNKGSMKPTPKGLSIAVARLPEFIQGLEAVKREAVAKGWLKAA